MAETVRPYYVADVLRQLKTYWFISNHPDAVKAWDYALENKLVEQNAEGRWIVNSDGYNFILDFTAD